MGPMAHPTGTIARIDQFAVERAGFAPLRSPSLRSGSRSCASAAPPQLGRDSVGGSFFQFSTVSLELTIFFKKRLAFSIEFPDSGRLQGAQTLAFATARIKSQAGLPPGSGTPRHYAHWNCLPPLRGTLLQ